ncbi:MAG: tetratricopeptide repeat protein [Bacteroidales bacterium]|jgi:tetratricopeptide (TPR) repeat protein|nr:tetratricopeptide repeat protein [Bacteroidales bacterium]
METLVNKKISYDLQYDLKILLQIFKSSNLQILSAISIFLVCSLNLFSQTNYTILQEAFSKSYAYESRGNFSDAITAIKSVYKEDSYEINLRLGWVTYLNGLFTESAAYYQKAINLKPYAIEPKFGFVYPASALGNWDQVINQYNDILAIDPQNTQANYRMGSIFYGRKDYTKAEKYLEKVINLYPFDYDSMILYAWTNFKLGKLREAQVMFNKVLLNKPTDVSALEGLGLIK